MQTVIVYMKENCPLCDEAVSLLKSLSFHYALTIEQRDIETNDDWWARYRLEIPVVISGNRTLTADEISYEALDQILSIASSK